MIKVKICGLTREEDITYVNQLKPDYVGFVFAKSKRQVSPVIVQRLKDKLDQSIKTVGVFVNTPIYEVKRVAEVCGLDIVQLHGEEKNEDIQSIPQEVWKSFRIKNIDSFQELDAYNVEGFLLDTYVEGEYGGTGKPFDWVEIPIVHREKFIILAGGLTSENVIHGIKKISPAVMDISSGVETNGYKDFDKMKQFIERVRGYDGQFITNEIR